MSQRDLISECLHDRTWAVVGFSKCEYKFGHIIYQDLIQVGFKVYPVNLRGGNYEGRTIYQNIKDLPKKPGVVNIVTPPRKTEILVKECAEVGIERVWMQPGAESAEAIRFCQEAELQVIYNACVLVELRSRSI